MRKMHMLMFVLALAVSFIIFHQHQHQQQLSKTKVLQTRGTRPDQASIIIDVLPVDTETDVEVQVYKDDVHDHAIQKTVKLSYEKLKLSSLSLSSVLDPVKALSEIKSYLFNSYNGDVAIKERAYSVLRTMERYNEKLNYLGNGVSELNILALVWARIHNPVNHGVRDELLNNLMDELADASATLDSSRCVSGRIARIIQSLESLDSENIVNIASTSSLKVELGNKIPLLIKSFLKHKQLEEKYNQGDKTTENMVRDFVRDSLLTDYVNTDLMSKEIIDEFLEAI